MPTEPIPVIALTGFLGSGKTTLMNHLLEHNHGLKIGVVVNDYGDINIDAQFVSNQTDTTLELTNGCICCSMDSMELDEAIGQFAYPGSPVDYIVIEASGLAEPADLAHTLRNAMTPSTRLDSIVAVLDASNWEHSHEVKTIVTNQIEHGDFVVINKTDMASQTATNRLKAFITGRNDRARMFVTTGAVVDPRLLFGHQMSVAPLEAPDHSHGHHQHLHERYTSISFTADQPLDPAAFQTFVNQQLPPEVYRAKGIVDFGAKGRGRKYLFQLVGKRAELTWAEWDSQSPRTELVFIGRDFDAAAVKQSVAACIDPKPNIIDPAKLVTAPRQRQ